MTSKELKERTKQFSLDVVVLISSLNKNMVSDVLGRQLLKSGTSVGANYRAACRSKSKPDFINKVAIVIKETDESQFWLELMVGSGIVKREPALKLWQQADELVRIMTATSKTAKSNAKK